MVKQLLGIDGNSLGSLLTATDGCETAGLIVLLFLYLWFLLMVFYQIKLYRNLMGEILRHVIQG